MGRNDQFIRQHVLLRRLGRSRFGCTLDDLRRGLEADLGLGKLSNRTVRRDLEALQAAGYGVDTERTPGGVVWRFAQPAAEQMLTAISVPELLALDAAVASLTRDEPAQARWIRSLIEKLRQAAPEVTLRRYELQRQASAGLPSDSTALPRPKKTKNLRPSVT